MQVLKVMKQHINLSKHYVWWLVTDEYGLQLKIYDIHQMVVFAA